MTPMNEEQINEKAAKIRATLGTLAESYRFDLEDFLMDLSISLGGKIINDGGRERQITQVYIPDPVGNTLEITLTLEDI
jgi:hypothetical protein